MQLGCLSTIATLRQTNLTIVVMDNSCYQITGSQPTATAFGTDIVAIARGSGIEQSHWALGEDAFEGLVEQALADDGPWLIAARIDDKPAVATTKRDPALIRERFMRGLGVKQ